MSDKLDIGRALSRIYGQDGWGVTNKLPRRDQLAPEGSFARAFNPIYLGKGPEPENPGGGWMSVMEKFTSWSRGLISTETLIEWMRTATMTGQELHEAARAYLGVDGNDAVLCLSERGSDLQFEHALNYWEPRITTIFVQNYTKWGTFLFNTMIENVLAREIPIFHSVYLHPEEDAYQVKLKCHGENGLWVAFMITREQAQDIAHGYGGRVMSMGIRPQQELVKPIEKMSTDEFAQEFRKQTGRTA